MLTAIGNGVGDARKKRLTRNLLLTCGSSLMALQSTVAESAPRDGEHVECGPAATSDVNVKSRSLILAQLLLSMAMNWKLKPESATTASNDVSLKRER